MSFLRSKLRSKVVLSVNLIMFISGLIIIVFLYQYTLRTIIKNSEETFLTGAENISRMVHDSLHDSLHSVQVISFDQNLSEYLEGESTIQDQKILDQLKLYQKSGDLLALSVINATGTIIVSTDPGQINLSVSSSEYFFSVKNNEPGVSLAFGVASHKPSYFFSYPVFNKDNKFLGAVVAQFDSSIIDGLIMSAAKEKRILMLVDKNGIVLSSNKSGRVFKSLGSLTAVELENLKKEQQFNNFYPSSLGYDSVLGVIKNYSQPVVYDYFDNNEQKQEILILNKIESVPFYLIKEVKVQDVYGGAYKAAAVISIVVFVAIILTSIMVALIINKFLKPLKDLQEMAIAIGNGNFNNKNPIQSSDEFFDLGNLLETVSVQLSDLYGKLEKKVKERTLELENINNNLIKSEKKLNEEINNSKKLALDLLKFKMAMDSVSEQIIITDADGVVIYGNSAIKKITGYSLKEVIGTKAGKLWSKPMPDEFYANMWKTIRDDRKVFSSEITNRRKNGELYEATINISPVIDDTGKVLYFVGNERDITVQKNIDRAKTEFVSLASHQLRTPLTTVSWYAEILKTTGKLSNKQKDFLKEIYNGNKRMINLVNSLLNVSRIELGTFAVDPTLSTIEECMKLVLKELEPEIKEKKIKISNELDKSIGKLPLDQNLLKVILQNLLTNSVKYSSIKDKVFIRAIKSGEFVEISIEDTGCGIPKIEQVKIFEKLYRASNVQAKDTSGSGLGLYIVKSIVEEIGGKIWFESEENKGTKFYFTIPLTGMKQKIGSKPLT